MRTTIDLPDDLLRRLKAQAALEGTTFETLVRGLLQQGLCASGKQAPILSTGPAALPSIRLGRPLDLREPSNAALFELLDY